MENKFTEEDKKMFTEFLNYVYANAEFNNMKYSDVVGSFKLLNYMQTKILPKIDANILEIIDVIESEETKE
jgi:hypothetical protein